VAGGVAQVSGTGGNVRIVRRSPTAAIPLPPPVAPTPPPSPPGGVLAGDGGQRVRHSTILGPVDHVRDTTGDVNIDQRL